MDGHKELEKIIQTGAVQEQPAMLQEEEQQAGPVLLDNEQAEQADEQQGASQLKAVRQSILGNLNSGRFAAAEGMQIRAAEPQSMERESAEHEKAIRDAFRKYARQIEDAGIWALLNNEKDSPEEGSSYYRQMRDAAEHVRELDERLSLGGDAQAEEGEDALERTIVDQVSVSELTEAMTRLSETAHIYYDMHRGTRYSSRGRNRKEACNKIRELTDHFFDDLGLKLNGEGLIPRSYSRGMNDVDGKQAVNRLYELVKYYKKWSKHFAYNEADERANVKAKADLLSVYEREMEVYRAAYRDHPQDMDPDIAYVIREARYYKTQNSVLERLEKSGELQKDPLRETAKDHADEMDYREREEELSAKEVDRDLSEEQIKAVEKIDRWFLRNYNNGGLIGRPLNIKNHHGEIVSELMSRTKRERLFIYYLIETGARKDPKVFDAYASQTEYIPSLDRLKGQMVASKLKVMSRLVGGYVYMHKLSEALLINRDYKELIKDSAKLTRAGKEGRAEEELRDPVEIRSLRLKKAYQSCMAYKRAAEKCSKGKKGDRAALEAEAAEAESRYRADLNALIEADNAVGEASGRYGITGEDGEKRADRVLNHADNNSADFKTHLDTYSGGAAAAGGYVGTGVNVAMTAADILNRKHGGVSWRLAESNLARVNEYASGYGASTISGLGHAMAMLYGIYNLYENGAKMHAGDIGKQVTEILKGGAETYISYRTGVELADKYAKLAKDWDADKLVGVSKSLKIAGGVTSGVGLMLNAYNVASGKLDMENADNAGKYLNRKYQEQKHLLEGDAGESAKQRKERLQQAKEVRYEQNMVKLAKEMSTHKTKFAAYESMSTTASLVSLVIPGIGGVVASTAGFVGGVITSILNAVDMGDIRQRMFDTYFRFDEFMTKVKAKMAEKGRRLYDEKQFKDRMRRKLAAAAGFADMVSAADQIAKRYADQICGRLFGGAEMAEDEKKGYIQLIKAFGLPYNESRRIPDARLLAKKMTGR